MNRFYTKHLAYTIATFLLVPTVASAATFKSLINEIVDVLNLIVPVLVAVALVGFLWGLSKYLIGGVGGEDAIKARKLMVFGIIGIFVMVSVWGLVNFVASTLFGGAT